MEDPLSFRNKNNYENMIDLLIADNIITQEGSLYQLTKDGKEYFSY